MSRVGKQPVNLPEGVDVNIANNTILIKGKRGELKSSYPESVKVIKEESKIIVSPVNDSKSSKGSWGLIRTIINNMIVGVEEGFTKSLIVNGVGYRASVSDGILTLQLGYSHDIKLAIPKDLEVKCTKPTEIDISGIDKQKVGQFASEIRSLRKPEPYKGKGVRYSDEVIRRKEGKKK
ncbi:MAG: 50S ribosomal protein L6 [Pelagibacterales bacterium]|nr:50S ribosomal protein L6 [Pelagibacterales bacterium]OUU62137.1 MAG: 50S ribosomal protein L6 [Alphaproteobacteria bacterium TMED62]|tara:strand:- start:14316 stop:14849 length:534 start_codon:yes stop_codon:yes gene_type:complete